MRNHIQGTSDGDNRYDVEDAMIYFCNIGRCVHEKFKKGPGMDNFHFRRFQIVAIYINYARIYFISI